MVINLLHQSHVGRDHRFTRFVSRKGLADLHVLEGGIDRVSCALACMPHGRHDVLAAEHACIGARRDVGPVGFDIGQMQHPGCVTGFAHEIDGAVGHVGCFRVFFGDTGGVTRIAQRPAREHRAVLCHSGIGKIIPGIGALVSLASQPAVVGEVRIEVLVGVFAVVALEGFKPALGGEHAQAALRIKAHARHALGIGAHVRLAGEGDAHAMGSHVVAQRPGADVQGNEIPRGAMAECVASGVERHARGPAYRRAGVGTRVAHAHRGNSIDVGCGEPALAVAGEVIGPQLVGHDEKHVFCGAHKVTILKVDPAFFFIRLIQVAGCFAMSTALPPPNPKELDMAALTRTS